MAGGKQRRFGRKPRRSTQEPRLYSPVTIARAAPNDPARKHPLPCQDPSCWWHHDDTPADDDP